MRFHTPADSMDGTAREDKATRQHAGRRILPMVVVATGVLAILAAATAIAGHYQSIESVDAFSATPSPAQPLDPGEASMEATGTCPPSFDMGRGPPPVTRAGQLVPTGAVAATLCTYRWEHAAVMPLAASRSLVGGAGDLVTYLNGLPDKSYGEDPARPGEQRVPACADMIRPAYRIVLTYADRPAAVVDVDPNCAAAAQGGAVRSLSKLPELLEFWPS